MGRYQWWESQAVLSLSDEDFWLVKRLYSWTLSHWKKLKKLSNAYAGDGEQCVSRTPRKTLTFVL